MNIVAMLQRWMDSKAGQTFLNYAYSWGASIVILGTLFKLTHIPGANLMLFIGMGTEVVVFFLSAFDRPFEKGSTDENQATSTATPQAGSSVAPTLIGAATPAGSEAQATEDAGQATTSATNQPTGGNATVVGGSTIVIAGGNGFAGNVGEQQAANEEPSSEEETAATNPFTPSPGLQSVATQQGITSNSLLDIIRLANEELLQRAQSSLTPEMEEASKQYVEKLQLLTETLDRVEKQSARLTTDSEEMTNLNRTLTGINTVYELQLKSVSQQIGTIDSINEQTRKMAKQIVELNGVYARMIKALTVNMKNAANTAGD